MSLSSQKRAAVVLSGCGYLDGSEIHESVLALYLLNKHGFETQCYAPNKAQMHTVNHLTRDVYPHQTRNVLEESARIARSAVLALNTLDIADYDALVLPGGYGAAKNLSDFARGNHADGAADATCVVDSDLEQAITHAFIQKKPIVAICIAPVLVAASLHNRGIHAHATLTIGDDANTAAALEHMGAVHQKCVVTRCIVDTKNRIITTPAYMYQASLADVGTGIESAIVALRDMCFSDSLVS